ncbi:hypothetical protein NP603_13825 [Methylomonas sp. SURF-1]|uniref:DUF2489 domain-containing protein n=1 Tax=Methylomonas aurea TaxID=2952224 RepID=A0ABT1UL98_9GAMM|nr:hypothetical protein [Methylomonas sp. SURF-1]MCQ8182196.1 hypothetical protein [Methylomonas sp. SURF-1]
MLDTGLLSSLISAGAVLAGAGLQQAFSLLGKRAEQKQAIRKLRREKLEELADLVFRHQVASLATFERFVQCSRTKQCFEPLPIAPDQYALQICSLSLLFFPDLKALADDFLKASVDLQFIYAAGESDQLRPASQRENKARQALQDAMERYAKRLGFHD